MTLGEVMDLKLTHKRSVVIVLLCAFFLSGCVGAVVGAAVDTTIEVAKVPFKVAGAAVDLVTPDSEED